MDKTNKPSAYASIHPLTAEEVTRLARMAENTADDLLLSACQQYQSELDNGDEPSPHSRSFKVLVDAIPSLEIFEREILVCDLHNSKLALAEAGERLARLGHPTATAAAKLFVESAHGLAQIANAMAELAAINARISEKFAAISKAQDRIDDSLAVLAKGLVNVRAQEQS